MKLSRIRIEALRGFREPVEIDGLEEGVNLFVGPNGAGKSTIVRAIRAAFFERYKSTSVKDLLPWGEPDAAPSVEVDFTSGANRYRLRKRFLSRSRCSLDIDGKMRENDDAEAWLAELLGYQYAGKGESKERHWGVPGLLWIEQGNAGERLHETVGYATDQLRKALDESLGEVASTDGDEVFLRVQTERDKLLTRTGQVTGDLRDAARALAEAGAELAILRTRLETYQEQVDRFTVLRAQIQAGQREQPWKRLEEQAGEVQRQLDRIGQLRDTLASDRRLLEQTEAQLRLLEEHQTTFTAHGRLLTQREQAASVAAAAVADAELVLTPRRQQLERAQATQVQAQAVLALAEQLEQRRNLQERIAGLMARHIELEGKLVEAKAIVERLNGFRQEAARNRIGDDDLVALRGREREIQAARIRLEAVATGLSFQLEPGRTIERDGEPLTGSGRLQLLARAVLRIPDFGELTIEPGGGQDLAALAAATKQLQATQTALLQSLGAESLPEAEQRLQQRKAAEHDAKLAQALLGQLAPKGLDVMAAELAALAGEQSDADARFAALSQAAQPLHTTPAPLAVARSACDEAAVGLRAAEQAEQAAREKCAAAKGTANHAQVELSALQAQAQNAAYRTRVEQNLAELEATRRRLTALAATVADAQRRIEAAQPLVLKQDVERLRRSAAQAQEAHEEGRRELARLQSLLDAAGADGLEVQLANAEGMQSRLLRRHDELERRSKALDLLFNRLQTGRQALTSRLQAPLMARFAHYLHLLMPGAVVTIDEALRPIALDMRRDVGRDVGRDAGRGSGGLPAYAELSFGTREQISLISRLAYADLLKQANRPTLIIVDDGLVNTDATRLLQMKRILYDAATRHQILLFSCHPERWADLGAQARDVQSLRRAHQRVPTELPEPINGD